MLPAGHRAGALIVAGEEEQSLRTHRERGEHLERERKEKESREMVDFVKDLGIYTPFRFRVRSPTLSTCTFSHHHPQLQSHGPDLSNP